METFNDVTLVFEKFAGTKKNEKGERTARFTITNKPNHFGISTKLICFAKTAKNLKKGDEMGVNSMACSLSKDGYRWINSIN